MNGFFHFHEVTVFLARKANRAEINEIIKAISGATKRAFPEIPMHIKVNIRWVNSDFKFSDTEKKVSDRAGSGEKFPTQDPENRIPDPGSRIPKGFNRRTVPVQI